MYQRSTRETRQYYQNSEGRENAMQYLIFVHKGAMSTPKIIDICISTSLKLYN